MAYNNEGFNQVNTLIKEIEKLEKKIKALEKLYLNSKDKSAKAGNLVAGKVQIIKEIEKEFEQFKQEVAVSKDKKTIDSYKAQIQSLNEKLNKIVNEKNKIVEENYQLNERLETESSANYDNDVKLVFAGFGVDIGETLDKGEREKLYKIVTKLRKKDTKEKAKDEDSVSEYDNKIDKIIETIQDTRKSLKAKENIDVKYVENIINKEMNKSKFSGLTKTTKVLILGGLGVLLAIGAIAGTNWYFKHQEADKLGNENTTLIQDNEELKEINELQADYGNVVATIEANVQNVYKNKENAEVLDGVKNSSAQKVEPLAMSNMSKNSEDKYTQAYNDVKSAAAQVSNLVALNEEGKISSGVVATAMQNYSEAIEEQNKEDANTYFMELEGYKTTVATALSTSNDGYSTMLTETGITAEQLSALQELVNNPAANVVFTAEDIKNYQEELRSNDFELGGIAKNVLSCTYNKTTGEVNIAVECESMYKEAYIHHLTFTIDKEIKYISSVNTLLKGLSDNSVKVTSVSAKIDNTLETSDSSNTFFYNTSKSYNKSSNSTTYKGEVIVLLRDGNGNITGSKAVKSEVSRQGNVKADAEVSAKMEAKLKEELVKEINKLGFNVELTQMIEIENN